MAVEMAGSDIRTVRESVGLERLSFAKLCGVATSTVYRWEAEPIAKPDPLQRAVLVTLSKVAASMSERDRMKLGRALEETSNADGPLAGIAMLHAASRRVA